METVQAHGQGHKYNCHRHNCAFQKNSKNVFCV